MAIYIIEHLEPKVFKWCLLLVDFVNLKVAEGAAFQDAVVQSAAARAKPFALTALAAMLGAGFILGDPIFNGLAISLLFGIAVSTLLTLVVIPVLYYALMRTRLEPPPPPAGPAAATLSHP